MENLLKALLSWGLFVFVWLAVRSVIATYFSNPTWGPQPIDTALLLSLVAGLLVLVGIAIWRG